MSLIHYHFLFVSHLSYVWIESVRSVIKIVYFSVPLCQTPLCYYIQENNILLIIYYSIYISKLDIYSFYRIYISKPDIYIYYAQSMVKTVVLGFVVFGILLSLYSSAIRVYVRLTPISLIPILAIKLSKFTGTLCLSQINFKTEIVSTSRFTVCQTWLSKLVNSDANICSLSIILLSAG